MTEKSELVSDQAAKIEQEWERLGRPCVNVEWPMLDKLARRHRFVSMAALDQLKRSLKLIPCPSCIDDTNGVEVTQLCVTMEDHPIADTGHILNAVCHHCGFQQMWPYKPQKPAAIEDYMSAKMAQRMAGGVIGGAGVSGLPSSMPTPPPEYIKRLIDAGLINNPNIKLTP